MKIGALITAAGMSGRMGEFKPMLPICSISVAQRVVATLSQAGVSKIVMVTGCNATVLERHLAGNGIIFLRNDAYETTQMFDSVKIGLSYLLDKCDKVLFTPVDVPLFTAKTVKAILDSDAPLAVPMCGGKQGHPILIANELIPEILKDSGEMGLKGAMDRCSIPRHRVEVEDLGTIYDADTPEDFAALVEYHNAQLARPLVSVSLAKEKPFFDSQIAMLLMLVDETKSVRAAGKPHCRTAENFIGYHADTDPHVFTAAFDRYAPKLMAHVPEAAVVELDEIGFLEANWKAFCRAVLRLMDGDRPVIAAVKNRDIPFLNRIRAHPKAQCFSITPENRDPLYEEVLRFMKQQLEESL